MKLNLRLLRHRNGWSQLEAANHIGISLDHVRSLEQGRKNPSLKTIKKIADAFGCSTIDEIIQAS